MLQIPRWKRILIVAVCALGILYALPNVLPAGLQERMESALPGFMPQKTVNLGLDLQGGSHLLLEVQLDSVLKRRADGLVDGLRPALREARVGYRNLRELEDGVRVTLRDPEDAQAVRVALRSLDRELTISQDGDVITAEFGAEAKEQLAARTIAQSIEIVRRRIDETGTNEPVIQRQGDERILVQLPGLDNPERVKELLGRTAQLGFHLVNLDLSASRRAGDGEIILPLQEEPGQTLALQRRAIITGDMLENASFTQDQSGQPAVSFRLNTQGAKRFCDVSRENVGRPFAIVLDDVIISAPNIREAICGGQGQISGSFTVKEANDLALLLRAGALPAPLEIIEERTVGPSLGADSVEAGKIASLIGLALVLVFMIVAYGLFGCFASAAMLINIALLMAVLSALQATLTLPGIAGIVLTVGMSVDANVLIFERIREELRHGKSGIAAIDTGFRTAMGTIIDSNLTTLIAAAILYSFGTGPIKGFAVTLSIGIITSMLTAIMLVRLMVVTWLGKKRPADLPV